ncbi:MAG: hypothetical protein ACTSQE_16475 [Candidatus Heimdallarchaeaceae archaeon]
MPSSRRLFRNFLDISVFIFIFGALVIYAKHVDNGFTQLLFLSLGSIAGMTLIAIVSIKFLTTRSVNLLTIIFETLYIVVSILGAISISYLPIAIITLIAGKATILSYIFFYSVLVVYPLIHIINLINILSKERGMNKTQFITYLFSKDRKEYKKQLILEQKLRFEKLYENIERVQMNYQQRTSRYLTVEDILGTNKLEE